MRCSAFIVGLLLFTAAFTGAQEPKVHAIQAPGLAYVFGVKGGMSYSHMYLREQDPNEYVSYHPRTGVYLGVAYHKPLSANWALQPELVYAVQGYKRTYRDSWNYEYHEEINQGYFNLPLLVQYVSPAGVVLYTGPQPGAVLVNGYEEVKGFDLAWVGGVAYFTKWGLGVEARYNAGLLNVASRQYSYLPFTTARNRVGQAGVVYLLAFAHKR